MSITPRATAAGLPAGEHRRLLSSLVMAAWITAAASVVVAIVVSTVALRLYLAELRAREAFDDMRAKLAAPVAPRR